VDEVVAEVQEAVLAWYGAFGRDLPWRQTRDPYAILVSEVMLQQTGVERVLPKYHEFLARFPTIQELAAAPTGAVIRIWAGLGYNMRAVRLQGVARQVVAAHGGVIPSTVEELLALAGVGRYTAGAVACFAYGRDVAFLDTNIKRVLGRVFRGPEDEAPPLSEGAALRLAEAVFPRGRAYEWHQALMDIGATLCTLRAPVCLACPASQWCRSRFRAGYARPVERARGLREAGPVWEVSPPDAPDVPTSRKGRKEPTKEGPFVGSTRYYRGRIIAALRAVPPGDALDLPRLGRQVKPDFGGADLSWLGDLVRRLARDGLLEVVGGESDDPAVWRVALPA
jgi:A/G-specific adenine glycosylase